jgi:orotate phosphoribosyltransferase
MNAPFIEFLAKSGAVKFGEFVLKSGRESPYFISTGVLADGLLTYELGRYYAQKIKERFGDDFDAVYGPAYKGIPLAVATCIALGKEYGMNKPWIFDRKEKKLHGDRGAFVGGDIDDGARVILVDDVMTTGGTKAEAIEKIKSSLNAKLIGVVIAVDRMERSNKKTAIEEFTEKTGIPVYPVENIRNIFEHLKSTPIEGKIHVSEKTYGKYVEYMKKYGV